MSRRAVELLIDYGVVLPMPQFPTITSSATARRRIRVIQQPTHSYAVDLIQLQA